MSYTVIYRHHSSDEHCSDEHCEVSGLSLMRADDAIECIEEDPNFRLVALRDDSDGSLY